MQTLKEQKRIVGYILVLDENEMRKNYSESSILQFYYFSRLITSDGTSNYADHLYAS